MRHKTVSEHQNQPNPFRLPEGNVQISFSGGRTSAYMLHCILDVNGDLDPMKHKVIFSNTGREMPQTLDFVQEVSDRWSVPIVWVEDRPRDGGALFNVVSHNSASRDGQPFAGLIGRKKACPDQSKRFCTENLKILPARRYLIAHGWEKWINAIGIRADEAHRCKPSPDKRVERWFPLTEAVVNKDMVNRFWAFNGWDLRVPEGLGNCDGCFLKSEASLAALARDYPERHKWWEDMEALATSLTKSEGGARFRKEFTRKELRNMVERQGDWIFDMEGALCQASDGECTI